MRRIILTLTIALLLILAACGKAECKTNIDCNKPHFTAQCTDKKCVYTPIPNECGNLKCDGQENKCTCPQDCGVCTGTVPNSQYLVQQCTPDNKQCLEDVKTDLVKPVYVSADQNSAGDKFKIDTNYNQPFNLKKDTITLTITLTEQATANKDQHIQAIELTATTKDKRTITLTRHIVDKYLWTTGSTIQEDIILDFPTAELESELTSLLLKIQYDYSILSAGKKTTRQATIQNRYKETFKFANPSATYPCPASCDDKNPGTRDTCGPQTNSFCKHEPIANACGNYKCDGNENRCTCPQDCGQCTGSAGNFLDYSCKTNQCITTLKPGANIQPNTIFDDRSLGPVQIHINYKYNNPLNVKEEEMGIDFKIYRQDPTVSDVIIETVRILEGQQQIAETQVNEQLGSETKEVKVKIPNITDPEEDHQLTIGIWYKYTQEVSGTQQEKTGKFEKSIGKVTLIAPE